MRNRKNIYVIASSLIVALISSSCAHNVRQSAIDIVREGAFRDAEMCAFDTKEYIKEHGENSAIKIALEQLTNSARDPDSVKTRDVFLVSYGDGILVCGEINGKNGYGGYTGFTKFYAGNRCNRIANPSGSVNAYNNALDSGVIDACSSR